MLVFDIGANVGKFTEVYARKQNTEVVSVEASPTTFLTLSSNMRNYTNVKIVHAAISDSKEKTITFYNTNNTLATLDKDWLTSPTSRFGGTPQRYVEIEVPTRTLDSLIEQYGIPDYLKIDVEGAEERVVRSLTKKVPVLSFEWAAEWRESLKRATLYLESLGFHHFFIQKEDKYDFWPSEFPLSIHEVCIYLDEAKDKEDWGMIWAK